MIPYENTFHLVHKIDTGIRDCVASTYMILYCRYFQGFFVSRCLPPVRLATRGIFGAVLGAVAEASSGLATSISGSDDGGEGARAAPLNFPRYGTSVGNKGGNIFQSLDAHPPDHMKYPPKWCYVQWFNMPECRVTLMLL